MITILMLLIAAAALAQPEFVTDTDGVLRVVNPESPQQGAHRVVLEELWRAGGDDEDLLIGFIPDLIVDDDDTVYALDNQLSEIQVFTADGSHVNTLGREGEGPGEFRNGATMFWTPDGELGVIQGWPGKIVLLNVDGTPGPMFSLTFNDGAGFQNASNGAGRDGRIVLSGNAWVTRDGEQRSLSYLKAYDMNGTELAHYHLDDRPSTFGGMQFEEDTFVDFQRRWAAAPDGRVAAALSFNAYRIHVWNADGSLDRIIERPGYKAVERTADETAMMQTMFERMTRWNPNSSFTVSKTHQAISQVLFRDDGSLWVQSSRDRWRSADDVFTSYDVYDADGRYVRRVNLLGDADPVEDGVFMAHDRVYVVTDMLSSLMMALGAEDETETEPEPVSIIAYDAALPVLAGEPTGSGATKTASP